MYEHVEQLLRFVDRNDAFLEKLWRLVAVETEARKVRAGDYEGQSARDGECSLMVEMLTWPEEVLVRNVDVTVI